ncbi:MAG: SDR family oxidoreductase [Chitinophagales bacterium]
MANKVFALTGVTGFFGRNVFFEIVKDNLHQLDSIELIILGRSSAQQTLSERMKDIFFNDGLDYLAASSDKLPELKVFFDTKVHFVNIELTNDELISNDELNKLKGKTIHYFMHLAAFSNFKNSAENIAKLHQINVKGTENLLNLVSKLDVKEFDYVSTAYVCGATYNEIQPDYVNLDQKFRNPYERSKLQAEILVKAYQDRTGLRCRIFRPTTISGRLLENEIGAIPKFDVFYGWAAFFLHWKTMVCKNNTESIYDEELEVKLRVLADLNSGINIIPVDFAAKILYQTCIQNLEGDYFHLVNEEETPTEWCVQQIFKVLNITGYSFVDKMPKDLNNLESTYHNVVGVFLTPYLIQEKIKFNTDNLQALYKKLNLFCPEVEETKLEILLNFAKSKNFGLPLKPAYSEKMY